MQDESLKTDLSVKAEIDLFYDLYVPTGSDGPAPLLIAVHGYGAHKRYMMREARAIAPAGFSIAAIEAPHPHYRKTDDGFRVGYGWLSDHRPEQHIRLHHKFILDVIEKLASEGMVDNGRIFLYGFSQSCALNFRFAFTYPDVLAGIIGVCGGIPGDLDSNPVYKPFPGHTFYIYGDDDEFYTQAQFRDFDERLAALLPDYSSKQYHATHEISDEMRRDMADKLNKWS
jgi:predicted esterase